MRSVNVPKMKQPDIIRVVSELSGYSQKECKEVVENYLHVVRECLLSGREVCLQKLGTITLKYRPYKPPRMMPNVNFAGEERLVKERLEHNIPQFLVSQQLRNEMMEITWGNPIFKPDNAEKDEEEE